MASGTRRVILVGRTGLDAALRLDPGLEVLRARTALESVGELGSPLDEFSPVEATVVIGADADPGTDAGEYVRSLRVINPGVCTLLVGTDGRGVYDGAVNPAAGAEALRAVVRGGSAARGAAQAGGAAGAPAGPSPAFARPGSGQGVREAAPAGADGPGVPAASSLEAGDAPLVAALVSGRDVLVPAMELLRARTRRRDAMFVPRADGSTAPPDGVGETVPVSHGSRVFGWLAAPSGAGGLERGAAWLGAWLALREQQAQLRAAAFTDELTGAYNRRYFDRYLRAALEHAQSRRESVTLLLFDIDDFKKYNDRYGHGAGDEILRGTVSLLTSVIRPTDRVCRVGGDEFAVVFFEPTGPRSAGSRPPSSIWQIARRFQQQICEQRFPKLGAEAPGTLTISGGLATYPWDGRTIEELLQRADELAMRSKAQGKNVITLGPGAQRVCGVGDAP